MALAVRAGVGASTVLRIEHGTTTRPTWRVAWRLGQALGVCPHGVAELASVVTGRPLPAWPPRPA